MWEEFQGKQKQGLNNSCFIGIIGTKGLKYFSHQRVKIKIFQSLKG